MQGEIVQFVQSTSFMIGRILGVALPPETTIEAMVAEKIKTKSRGRERSESRIEAVTELVKSVQKLLEAQKGPSVRVISQISLQAFNKEQRQENLAFVSAAANLRCGNFKLKGIVKYKIERSIFEESVSSSPVSAISAALGVIELVKFLTVCRTWFNYSGLQLR